MKLTHQLIEALGFQAVTTNESYFGTPDRWDIELSFIEDGVWLYQDRILNKNSRVNTLASLIAAMVESFRHRGTCDIQKKLKELIG